MDLNDDDIENAGTTSTGRGRITRNETITVNVPSDYSTLQQAFDTVSQEVVPDGVEIVINIESGHELQSGNLGIEREAALYAHDGDYSHIRITSEDAEVPVSSSFEGSAIRNVRARGVVLDCLINMSNATSAFDGYTAEKGSKGYVNVNCGVKNAGRIGLYSRQVSAMYAARAAEDPAESGVVFTGAGDWGHYCNHGSRSYLRGGDFSGAGSIGIQVRHGAVSDASDCDVSDSNGEGYLAENSATINAALSTASNCGTDGISATHSSTVNARNLTAEGNGRRGIFAGQGSFVAAVGSDLNNNSEEGIHIVRGSRATVDNATAQNNTDADISIALGNIMSASDCTTTNGAPDVADASVASFNSVSGDGIIFSA